MKRLVCPTCDWDAASDGAHDFCFRYCEEVTSERRVEGFNDAGVLEVEGAETIAAEDEGVNARIRCGNCLHEFLLPEDIEIDFT